MSKLGFGMMRLPVLNSDQENFDYEQLNQMVDEFLEAGFTYFDTSYVYHNGKSEDATRKALIDRHPREAYTIATKFPTFLYPEEEKIEGIFQSQIDKLGVEYIDYYLLHNIQNSCYDALDDGESYVERVHLFDHAKKWKEQGKIRHLGMSFHSSAALLDRVLEEHPEIEFVQIALNGIDWDSKLVQAKACYETIRKHGRKVIIMEAVKGGGLSKLPAPAENLLRSAKPDQSISSWSIQFCMGLQDVIAVLSGMSTIEQVRDNVKTFREKKPFTKQEEELYFQAMALTRSAGEIPPSEWVKYEGLDWYGVPVSAIMDTYNTIMMQPNPGFSDDNNYLRNAVIELGHTTLENTEEGRFVLEDGTDVSDYVNGIIQKVKEFAF